MSQKPRGRSASLQMSQLRPNPSNALRRSSSPLHINGKAFDPLCSSLETPNLIELQGHYQEAPRVHSPRHPHTFSQPHDLPLPARPLHSPRLLRSQHPPMQDKRIHDRLHPPRSRHIGGLWCMHLHLRHARHGQNSHGPRSRCAVKCQRASGGAG